MTASMKRPKELHVEKPVRFIFAGGFLGSGKTTALAGIAQRLIKRGLRVGIVTNDQTVNLVDTAIVREMLGELGVPVVEVSKGCFCCRFDDLINVTEQVLAHNPDVMLGEPVGSCTDFAATVARPFKVFYPGLFHIAPFSVLTDPQRVREILLSETKTRFPDEVIYLYRKQLEEADIVVLNKVDLLTPDETQRLLSALKDVFPDKPVLAISAKEGTGMDEWLEMLMAPTVGGERILREIDYDRYATAEAELGWLNAAVQISSAQPFDVRAFARELMTQLHTAFKNANAEVAHLKFLLTSAGKSFWASLPQTDGKPSYGGSELGTPQSAMLIVNARVRMEPNALEQIVRNALTITADKMVLDAKVLEMQSFKPAYPRPPYRMAENCSAD